MNVYYVFLIMVGVCALILAVYLMLLKKKTVPMNLFVAALRDENNGYFEEAVIAYESALGEFKKIRTGGYLENKITEKLKLLHTVIEYKNSFPQSAKIKKSFFTKWRIMKKYKQRFRVNTELDHEKGSYLLYPDKKALNRKRRN